MFLLERVLLSLSLAGISGCDSALIYSSVSKEESQKVFGMYETFSTAGYLLASALYTILIRYSMDATAFYTIIPYAIATIITLFMKEVEHEHRGKFKFKESFKVVLKNKSLISIVISYAFITEVVQVVSIFLNQAQYLLCLEI